MERAEDMKSMKFWYVVMEASGGRRLDSTQISRGAKQLSSRDPRPIRVIPSAKPAYDYPLNDPSRPVELLLLAKIVLTPAATLA